MTYAIKPRILFGIRYDLWLVFVISVFLFFLNALDDLVWFVMLRLAHKNSVISVFLLCLNVLDDLVRFVLLRLADKNTVTSVFMSV